MEKRRGSIEALHERRFGFERRKVSGFEEAQVIIARRSRMQAFRSSQGGRSEAGANDVRGARERAGSTIARWKSTNATVSFGANMDERTDFRTER